MKILFIAVMSLILMGCPGQDFGTTIDLNVHNKSDDDIIALRSFHSETNADLPMSNPYIGNSQIVQDLIGGNSSEIFPEAYRELFEMDSFNFFVITFFSKDTVEQVPWERIRNENLILRRYDLTLEDLEVLDWTIEYP